MAEMKKFLFLAAVLVGCGGGDDGPSSSKKLADLSNSEATDLCHSFASDYPPKTVDCGADGTTTFGFDDADCTGSDNTFDSTCTATVGDLRDCADDLYNESDADICNQVVPPSCAAVSSCT